MLCCIERKRKNQTTLPLSLSHGGGGSMRASAGLGPPQSCCHNTPEGRQATHLSPLHRLIYGLISGFPIPRSPSTGVDAYPRRVVSLPGHPPYGHWSPLSRTVSLTPSQGSAVLWAQVATHQHRSKLPLQCQCQNPRGERTGFRKRTPETKGWNIKYFTCKQQFPDQVLARRSWIWFYLVFKVKPLF